MASRNSRARPRYNGVDLPLGSEVLPTATPMFSGDLNTIPGTGFHRVNRNDGVSTNLPPTLTGDHPWVYLTQIEHSAGFWRTQTARDFNGKSEQVRENANGVWGAWSPVPFKNDKTKLATLAAPERVYVAPPFVPAGSSDVPVTYTTGFWQSAALPPVITVPALGNPPAGFVWKMDITGAIRIFPPVSVPVFLAIGYNAVAATSVDGGSYVPTPQSAVPVFGVGRTPPSITTGFTINFYIFIGQSTGTYKYADGPSPAVRCYLVAA